jgi:anaerobic dimethyl sulfoxide reductase subunit C (anchor subunit)
MDQQERAWPLMSFTVLGPASVGCLLGTLLLRSAESSDRFGLAATTAALMIGVAGVLLSLAHLNKPLRAYRALRRLPASPLSREIGAYAVYVVLVFVAWLAELFGTAPGWLLGLGVAAGGVAIVASAQVYLLPARPSWRHWSTVSAFLGCGLSLGSSTALLIAAYADEGLSQTRAADVVRGLVVAGVIVSAISVWRRVVFLRSGTADTKAAWHAMSTDYSGLWWTRLIVGLALPLAATLLSRSADAWLWLTWLSLLAGELIDRRLFFASVVPLSFRAEITGVH